MSGLGRNSGLLIAAVVVFASIDQARAVNVAATPLSPRDAEDSIVTLSLVPLAVTGNRAGDQTMLFRATFTSGNWQGDVAAYRYPSGLSPTGLIWRASEQIPDFRKRRIFTMSRAGFGIGFQWSLLGADERAAIGSKAVLEYIRGSPANTVSRGGGFRNRASLLGDIVHSAPVVAGDQGYGYARLPGVAGNRYRAYVSGKRDKPDLILVGANDGMLHAFDVAGGSERFAYVPRQLFTKLPALANPDYAHHYYVDGTPVVADAWIDGAWATVVVTTLGRGGQGAFALDLTDPAVFGAASDVLWEISPASLASGDGDYLGVAMGAPAVVRLESGDWVALLGNGYNSTRGTAALLVVELGTGVVLAVLDTGVGGGNGLGAPLAIDRNRNNSVDTVYAGDLKGNLWKFDLSSDSAAGWVVGYGGRPLVTAVADNGARQPITARPDAIAHPRGGVLVVFGTGRFLAAADASRVAEQSLYGVWDTQGAGQDSDGDAIANQPIAAMRALVAQTLRIDSVVAGRGIRVVTDNPIDYGTGRAEQRGWVVDLSRSGERIVQAVRIFDGKAIAVTTIPRAHAFGGDSALIVLNPLTGSQFGRPLLDLNADGAFNTGDGVAGKHAKRMFYPGLVDLHVGIAGRPVIINRARGNQTLLLGGSSNSTEKLGMSGLLEIGRASWIRRR